MVQILMGENVGEIGETSSIHQNIFIQFITNYTECVQHNISIRQYIIRQTLPRVKSPKVCPAKIFYCTVQVCMHTLPIVNILSLAILALLPTS